MKTVRFTARGIDTFEFVIPMIEFAPLPQTANIISRVTPMETNLKFLWSLDYTGKSNVELIPTN